MRRPPSPSIHLAHGPDGTLIYLIEAAPQALPPVRTGDLADAWRTARHAAALSEWGSPRLFRFLGDDGPLDLALTDEDACCWMQAVDGIASLTSMDGLSLCIRLLALVDLLARASWTSRYCRISRAGATLDPALLRAAATVALTEQASFDESLLHDRLRLGAPAALALPDAPSPGALC